MMRTPETLSARLSRFRSLFFLLASSPGFFFVEARVRVTRQRTRSWWRWRGNWSRRSRRGRACASRSVASSSSSRSSRKDTFSTSTSFASSPERKHQPCSKSRQIKKLGRDSAIDLSDVIGLDLYHIEKKQAQNTVSEDPGLKLINEQLRLQPHQDVGSVVLAVEQEGNHPSLTCYLYGKTMGSLLLKELPFSTGLEDEIIILWYKMDAESRSLASPLEQSRRSLSFVKRGRGRPMAHREAKRPKLNQRWEGDYVPRSIVEIEIHNFMTYDHLKCKLVLRFNLVISPNGSGKSSLVCAISLGLTRELLAKLLEVFHVFGYIYSQIKVKDLGHTAYLENHATNYIRKVLCFCCSPLLRRMVLDRDFLVRNIKSYDIPVLNYVLERRLYKSAI